MYNDKTLRIKCSLHYRLKIAAARNGATLQKFVEAALINALRKGQNNGRRTQQTEAK